MDFLQFSPTPHVSTNVKSGNNQHQHTDCVISRGLSLSLSLSLSISLYLPQFLTFAHCRDFTTMYETLQSFPTPFLPLFSRESTKTRYHTKAFLFLPSFPPSTSVFLVIPSFQLEEQNSNVFCRFYSATINSLDNILNVNLTYLR